MTSIKMIGLLGIIIAMLALSGIVSADSSFGYSIAGSSVDVSGISMISDFGAQTTGYASPSALIYKISASGVGNLPSQGTMSAFLNYNSMTPSSDFAYSETASASGLIFGFSKSISVMF
jgi:hypothetical protein